MDRSLHSTLEERGSSPQSRRGQTAGLREAGGIASAIETIEKLTTAMQTSRAQGIRTFGDLALATQDWSNASAKAMSKALDLLTRHSLAEVASVAFHTNAERAKSQATVSALKQTALYKALSAAAAGFQALGSFDFWAAAQDFTSATLWGALAGAQVAGAVSGGGGRTGSSYSRGRARPEQGSGSFGQLGSHVGSSVSELAGGAASAKYGASGNLTVAIMGDNEAGEWLANTLNTAVEQRGVQLTSSRSTRGAYAQG
ncbi:MAG: hypothetical protein ACRD3D_10950 [Terriglobia bacterium]